MKLLLGLALFSVLSSFAFAQTTPLGMQYATSTLMHDCAQKALSITNRSEFQQFYSKPADESNIAKILALAADLSSKDPQAATAQQTYLQCGDYILSGRNGTLYWRGIELALPGYVSELEARVIELESQSFQLSIIQQTLQQRVLFLEEDALNVRSDFVRFQFYCLGLMALVLVLLVWQAFFSRKREGRQSEGLGIRHHVSKMFHKKRD